MRDSLKLMVGCCLALSFTAVRGQDCGRAVLPAEKTVCREPELTRMDAEMNRLYTAVRPRLTVKARGELLAQQRSWLVQRNRECATGDAGCLRKRYEARIAQLQAVTASAGTGDEKPGTTTTMILRGKWKASGIKDPAGAGQTNEADVRRSLDKAGLPAVGAVVGLGAGKLCLPAQECDQMAWSRTTLAKVAAGESIGRVFGLKQTSTIIEGDSGAAHAPSYQLLPQSDGTAWAVFVLCGANSANCHQAAEVWAPASPDATVPRL